MKLGFVSAILPELSLEQVLHFARAEGFACVEAMCWPAGRAERKFAGVTHVDVTRFTQAQADDINALCKRHGVSLSALGYYPNPLDPDPAVARRVVTHLKRVIVAAAKLGLSTVNTFVGRDWTRSVEDNWPQGRLFHVHAKDVKLRRDRMNEVGVFAHPLEWHQPRIPGFGEMDWGRFLGTLMETRYRGPVCIEVEDDTFGKTLEGRQQALRVAGNVLRPFLPG